MWAGCALAVLAWYGCVKWLPIDAFNRLPDPVTVVVEWFNPDPDYGLSVFTADYYLHIWYSTYRAFTAFALAVVLGVPLGILMGWRVRINEFASALLGLLRPIPPLAWVPIAILVFPGDEPAVIFVTSLVAFFATTMNTLLGVRSIDPDYFRAARCLGASPRDVLTDIIIPGALPSIFTGFQIAMGGGMVLAGGRRDDRGPVRSGIHDSRVLQPGAVPDDHHHDGNPRDRRLREQRGHPTGRKAPDAVAGGEPWALCDLIARRRARGGSGPARPPAPAKGSFRFAPWARSTTRTARTWSRSMNAASRSPPGGSSRWSVRPDAGRAPC